MTLIEGIVSGVAVGLASLFFWMFKRGHTRIDDIEKRLHHAVSEREVRQIIDDKLEPLRNNQMQMTHRIGRLEGKIDKLIELVMQRHT
jgi:hypothetical protein